MEYQATSLLGSKKIGITFTDKPVTPWGGLTLFSGLARQIGLETALREALPFRLTSPNATDPVEIILAFMAGVLAGSRRFAHAGADQRRIQQSKQTRPPAGQDNGYADKAALSISV